METTRRQRRLGALTFSAVLVLGGAACGEDEDGDGGTVDEEVDELDEKGEDAVDRAKKEAEESKKELDD